MRGTGGHGVNSFLRAGIPFVSLLVCGWLGLGKLMQDRYDIQDAKQKVLDERAPVSKIRARKFNMEEEHARLMKHVDLHSYKNKRVPRPD
ncbi:hypothetical protein BSKO_00013 [Bryopsis sp. KO-2023]|nr:hypothetical protein BSKO_00013 [Bryopsis sp. KO-2023]